MSADLYLQVLLESAWTASIIPMSSEPTYFAMQSFGGYDMHKAFALAVFGSSCGQLFNWLIGKFLFSLKNKGAFKLDERWYQRVNFLFNRYGVFTLFFCWAPLCNVLVAVSGFINTRLTIVLPLVVLGEMFNYGRILL